MYLPDQPATLCLPRVLRRSTNRCVLIRGPFIAGYKEPGGYPWAVTGTTPAYNVSTCTEYSYSVVTTDRHPPCFLSFPSLSAFSLPTYQLAT